MGKVSNVKCSVDECVYWGVGDVCEAEAIEVNRNVRAHEGTISGIGGRRDMETGRMGELGLRMRREGVAWTPGILCAGHFVRDRPGGTVD